MTSATTTAATVLRDDPGFAPLKGFIIEATGLAYYADKDDDLALRVSERLAASGEPDCAAYLQLLHDARAGAAELDRLVEQLTVGETSFFRHAELFDGLRATVLPDLLGRNRDRRRLRIWSAGCATGAEPYSIAILLARDFAAAVEGWEISILGTDINRRFLARAAEGVFRDWDFRGTCWSKIDDCFERRGAEWAIRAEYRKWVSFQWHNLVRHPYPSLINNLVAFDLILCRNVLIYLSTDTVNRVTQRLYACLVEGGWLLVGHAEPNVDRFRAFRTVNVPGAVLYQRPLTLASGAASAGAPAPPERAPIPLIAKRPAATAAPARAPARRAGSNGGVARADQAGRRLAEVRRMADAGALDAAVDACKRLVAADMMNPELHLHLALLAEQQGDRRQAEAALRRTIYLSPENALAHYFAGLLQQRGGRRSEAIRSYRNVLKLLAERADADLAPSADGVTVCDLRELARMQLEVARES